MNIELPKDAEGREIPLDTEVLYDKDGHPNDVSYFNICAAKLLQRLECRARGRI